MHWSVHVLLTLGPFVILALIFLILNAVLRKTGGYAPGWQFRCTKCNRTRDAGEAGVIRMRAASVGKRVLGYCCGCHRFRSLAVERQPSPERPTAPAVHA